MTRQSDVQESMKTLSNRTEKAVEIRKYDEKALQQRIQKIHADIAQRKLVDRKKADELAQIPLREEDVALIAQETGWSAQTSAQRLREKRGDTTALLREIVGLPKSKVTANTAA